MRLLCQVAGALALVTLASAPARAESFIAPFIGFNFGGDSANCASLRECEEKRANFGVSVGTRRGVLGFEQDIGYARDFFGKTPGADNAVLTVMSSLMVVIPAGPIHPYGIVGIGLIRPHVKLDLASLASNENALGYGIGGGLNIFLLRRIGIRGDVRRLKTVNDITLPLFSNEKLEFWRGSVGVTFRF